MNDLPDALNSFTGRLLAVRNTDRALTADIARGITETTERYAYQYTVPATTGIRRPAMILGATRALAMIAVNRRTANSNATLGRNFTQIPGNFDSIAEKLALLVDLDVEQAAAVIGDLVSRAPAVNFFALVRTLTFWDTGDLDRDTSHRTRLVYDFYSRPDSTPTDSEPKAA